jgi:hypothetical protein
MISKIFIALVAIANAVPFGVDAYDSGQMANSTSVILGAKVAPHKVIQRQDCPTCNRASEIETKIANGWHKWW